MIDAATPLLARLQAEAEQAEGQEAAYRKEAQARFKALEQERSFAFRRLNLLRAVSQAIQPAAKDTEAVGAAQRVLRDKLGWSTDSEPRVAVLQRFAVVALILHDPAKGPAEEAQALAQFEAWYREAHGTPFWILFEHYMPETPLVDF